MSKPRIAIVVAGGTGTRMGAEIPKQFLLLNGEPILMHTLKVFQSIASIQEIILVLPEHQIAAWQDLCNKFHFSIKHTIIAGGETRFQSVLNGLGAVSKPEALVAIHDGVRPLVSVDTIERCFAEAEIHDNAIPAIKPVETIRYIDDKGSHPLDRERVMLIQTPQVFKVSTIKRCYNTPWQPSFTDDASVAEFSGEKINLVEGNRENIKITTPQDILVAEAILKGKRI